MSDSDEKQIDASHSGTLRETLALLQNPATYADRPNSVETVETHISFVFLAGQLVYKLKKPVRSDSLDFSTPQARM